MCIVNSLINKVTKNQSPVLILLATDALFKNKIIEMKKLVTLGNK